MSMNVSIDSKSLHALLDLEKDLETEYASHAETRDKLYSNEAELRKLRNAIVEKNEEIWRLNDANEGKENLLQAFRKNTPSVGSAVQSMEVKIAYFRELMVILRELESGNAEHKIMQRGVGLRH
jgi:hypothetical protein